MGLLHGLISDGWMSALLNIQVAVASGRRPSRLAYQVDSDTQLRDLARVLGETRRETISGPLSRIARSGRVRVPGNLTQYPVCSPVESSHARRSGSRLRGRVRARTTNVILR